MTFGLLLIGSMFPVYFAFYHHDFLNDDTYITLTYVKNLIAGNGFVFNHAPATLGTSTPFFTLLTTGIGILLAGIDVSYIAVYLTVACWLASAWIFFWFRADWQLEDWQASILGIVVIATGWLGFLGMEAYLFTFLLLLSSLFFLRRNYFACGFFSSLLTLTRGEGIVFLSLIVMLTLVVNWYREKRFHFALWKPLGWLCLGFLIPALCWIAYAQLAIGTSIPNTLAAKQAQMQIGMGQAFLHRLLTEWMPRWGSQFVVGGIRWLNIWWLLIALGLISSLYRLHPLLLLAGWIGLYITAYSLINVSAYWWYQLPIVFVCNLFFAKGVIACIELLRHKIRPPRLASVLSCCAVLAILLRLALPTIQATTIFQGDSRGESYTALSDWFNQHAVKEESIAFIEVGYLGYYTENRIIDLAGLTLPDVVPHIKYGDLSWGFWHYQPDYYVYLPDFDWALAPIRANPEFDKLYKPVATLPGPRDAEFTIYKRVSN